MTLKKHPGYFKKGLPYVDQVHPAHHPRRGQHRGRAAHRPDPPRVHRGQQELQPAQGREVADRLSQLAPRLRLPQHQREPRARSRTCGCGRPSRGRSTAPRSCAWPPRASAGSPPPATGADEAVAAPRRAVDEVLQARRREGQEAHGRGGAGGRLHREARRDPDLPHDGLGRAGRRRPAQAHRHQRRDRERRVRGVDQAVAGQGLRHDDEHHAGLRRSRHRVLPRAALHQGPELELVERARPRRAAGGGPAHDGHRRSARRSTTACRS